MNCAFVLPITMSLWFLLPAAAALLTTQATKPSFSRHGSVVATFLRGGTSSPIVSYHNQGETAEPSRILVCMDCFCPYHGTYLVNRAQELFPDVAIVNCLSDYVCAYLMATDPDGEQWNAAKVPSDLTQWKLRFPDAATWVGVYCESDSGLADAEKLREMLNVQCQDKPTILTARRNKFEMNELVKQAGLETAQQDLCTSLEQALVFGKQLLDSKFVIVKPIRGVATESVYLCKTSDDIVNAWNKITSTTMFGSTDQMHTSVLVQECLVGTEYAVDVVARNGSYKVAAIWRYDKRPANGAPFCYFQTKLVDMDTDENVVAVVGYVNATLKALGVNWGLSHNEVILTDSHRGPVLVEVNCRQHNMDFLPLTMACVGYNALDMTLVALLGDEVTWNMFADCPTLRAAGCMVHLVNYAKGTLKQVYHLDTIDVLPSVLDFAIYDCFTKPGEEIEPTVDIRTDAGWVQLLSEDPSTMQDDFETIVKLMPTMFDVF
jgi:hypothetical protein